MSFYGAMGKGLDVMAFDVFSLLKLAVLGHNNWQVTANNCQLLAGSAKPPLPPM